MDDDEQVASKKEEFDEVPSSACCNISDIKSIVFGPVSSRFWLYRKHIITMESMENKKKLPFFAWECITLHLKNRDVDLVIKKQEDMDMFLQFLIYQMNTINGIKNSSLKLQKLVNKHVLMKKTLLKYKILRIRYKISYQAFITTQTVA